MGLYTEPLAQCMTVNIPTPIPYLKCYLRAISRECSSIYSRLLVYNLCYHWLGISASIPFGNREKLKLPIGRWQMVYGTG